MALNLGVKVFLILMCFSFVFSIAPHECSQAMYNSNQCHGVNVGEMTYGYGTGFNKLQQLFAAQTDSTVLVWLASVLFIASTVILATTAVFPNAFTLFAGIVGAFTGFVTIPWDLLQATNQLGFGTGQDVGAQIPGFFIVFFIFMLFIVIFAMFKGTDF